MPATGGQWVIRGQRQKGNGSLVQDDEVLMLLSCMCDYENPFLSLSFPKGTVGMKTTAPVYKVIGGIYLLTPPTTESGMTNTHPEAKGGFGPRYYHFLAKCSCVTH